MNETDRPSETVMMHGPFAPPEISGDPADQDVMERASSDPTLYQLLMLQESLITDHAHDQINESLYIDNMERLVDEIDKYKGIKLARQELRAAAHRKFLRERSDQED